MAERLDVDTPVGAYWMDAVNDQRSMDDYLRHVSLMEGPEALDALHRCAGDLIHKLDEGQFEEGEL